jgi:hypothetical protein
MDLHYIMAVWYDSNSACTIADNHSNCIDCASNLLFVSSAFHSMLLLLLLSGKKGD